MPLDRFPFKHIAELKIKHTSILLLRYNKPNNFKGFLILKIGWNFKYHDKNILCANEGSMRVLCSPYITDIDIHEQMVKRLFNWKWKLGQIF